MVTIGYEVPSCCEFLTGRTSHPGRCASYLLFGLKGQSKVISAVRSALDIADFATIGQKSVRGRITYANDVLGGVKRILNFANLPNEVASLSRKCGKMDRSFHVLYAGYLNGCPLGHRDWIRFGAYSAGVVKKILSIAGDSIFKPAQFVGKYAELGETGQVMGETWRLLSALKSSAKIAHCSGKIYLGSKKSASKVADIVLESGKLTFTILRYNCVHIHPILNIVLSVAKSLFGLAEAWIKTT